MAIPTRDLTYVEDAPVAPAAPLQLATANDVALMFERLASNPNVDVEKFERLMAMQERILAFQAKAAFDAAFSAMQPELPVIGERGDILANGQSRGRYAKYEDIQAAIKPILAKHGFSLRHRNHHLENGKLKIVAILGHTGGHREEDEFECPADKSGGKADIQAIGSTRSYGMRYTTIAILNIETRGLDDDGRAAFRSPTAPAAKPEQQVQPDAYDDILIAFGDEADKGTPALMAKWNDTTDKTVRAFLASTGAWETLKKRAAEKTAAMKGKR